MIKRHPDQEPNGVCDTLGKCLLVARYVELVGWLQPGDWPDVAVALLLEGAEDLEIAELAGFGRSVSGWTTQPLVEALYGRYQVSTPESDDAIEVVLGVLGAEFRSRPAAVTAPIIRLLAKLAAFDDTSDLVSQALGVEDYLDGGCGVTVDLSWETELAAHAGPAIPDRVVAAIAAPLRRSLPHSHPPRRHT